MSPFNAVHMAVVPGAFFESAVVEMDGMVMFRTHVSHHLVHVMAFIVEMRVGTMHQHPTHVVVMHPANHRHCSVVEIMATNDIKMMVVELLVHVVMVHEDVMVEGSVVPAAIFPVAVVPGYIAENAVVNVMMVEGVHGRLHGMMVHVVSSSEMAVREATMSEVGLVETSVFEMAVMELCVHGVVVVPVEVAVLEHHILKPHHVPVNVHETNILENHVLNMSVVPMLVSKGHVFNVASIIIDVHWGMCLWLDDDVIDLPMAAGLKSVCSTVVYSCLLDSQTASLVNSEGRSVLHRHPHVVMPPPAGGHHLFRASNGVCGAFLNHHDLSFSVVSLFITTHHLTGDCRDHGNS
jgi:hypothetical protein